MRPRTVRAADTDAETDIVDDSEPERAETRRKEKENRRVKRQMKGQDTFTKNSNKSIITAAVQLLGRPLHIAAASEVPSISSISLRGPMQLNDVIDDAISSSALSVHIAGSRAVSSVSSFVESEVSLPGPAALSPGTPRPPTQEAQLISQQPRSPGAVSVPSDDEEDIEAADRLSLGRFAHINSSKAVRPMKLAPMISRSMPEGSSGSGTKQNRTKPAHRFVSDFSDAEVAKVTKCVSCDLEWTTRKTSLQKMLHIQTCAKKSGLTDETVKVLVRRQIGKASDEGPGESGASAAADERAETYLEDVLGREAPKRKGRRPEVQRTVKSATDSRNAIMDKARLLLGPSAIGISDGQGASSLPATQSFGPSKFRDTVRDGLAERSASPSSYNTTNEEAPYAVKMRPPAAVVTTSFGSVNEHVPLTPSRANHRRQFDHVSPDLVEAIDLSNMSDDGASFYGMNNDNIMWQDDGALLHFDPSSTLNADEPSKKRRKAKTTSPKETVKKVTECETSSSGSVQSGTPKSTRKRKSKATTGQEDDVKEDKFKEAMRNAIMQDKTLHLRILRYEPIHYDVFVQLAVDQGFPLRGLNPKLMSCLDDLAIIYHGAGPDRNQKKRRRRKKSKGI
ncbi:hypothetical protein OE88DRAFT_681265 [Heliocybe sulcata]|uniref:Structure-specific endonuclease subunit SLX4 n=1 Tax=Heliocybe sulcata TaxID=5364 RepID=A0A5C3NDX4_9AGAM|nr:hypothetical protein OE88DRAFT_681265 [Heliocybe sulcata]